MPKKNNQNAQPNEPEIRADILAEEHDMEDELEENVGVPPRKVTMDEFVKADEEFNKLLASEEKEFERMPFRPGKNTKFVLTERQKDALKEGADEIEKYLKHDTRHSIEDNQRLQDLQNAMYRILEVGPDGLTRMKRRPSASSTRSWMANITWRPATTRPLSGIWITTKARMISKCERSTEAWTCSAF